MKWHRSLGAPALTRTWWRPAVITATAWAAIAALFSPVPAFAAPGVPGAVPDTGARPAIGSSSVTLPGQQPLPGATGTATTGVTGTSGITSTSLPSVMTTTPLSPVMKTVEAGRASVAAAAEAVTKVDEELALVRNQLTTADQKVAAGQAAVAAAQAEIKSAAASSVRDAAALPPGSTGSGLSDLGSLARIQRGDTATEEAAARQLTNAQAALNAAQAEQSDLTARLGVLTADRAKKKAAFDKKQATQQALEKKHSAEIIASETAEAAQDQQLSASYLGGTEVGRGAHPYAINALKVALSMRGKWYAWSEETPAAGFDCSGLMYYSYRQPGSGSFQLNRVARDQYHQTSEKTVDRYSLLPGDLLFFSYSSSWQDIHHVAMYAGDGMMVEAPRTGLQVRLTPVRWTRLFAATRIYGSVEGGPAGPILGAPDPEKPSTHTPTKPKPGATTTPKPGGGSSNPGGGSSNPGGGSGNPGGGSGNPGGGSGNPGGGSGSPTPPKPHDPPTTTKPPASSVPVEPSSPPATEPTEDPEPSETSEPAASTTPEPSESALASAQSKQSE
jgi:peptidoglycan DL-endopeptidase CwlO